MPNTIARPMSPAVGVNYDRNHMREIYQKKSIAYKCLKRCMDISLSGLALIVLSPVFLVTAAAIRLEDHGPVFFTQTRAGRKHRETFRDRSHVFRCYQQRST